jgi:hypothetical protein
MLTLSKKAKAVLWTTGALILMIVTIPLAIWLTHTQTAEFGNARARCTYLFHDHEADETTGTFTVSP